MDLDDVSGQPRGRGSVGLAVAAGVGAAVAGAVIWGLAAFLTRYQLSLLGLLMGLGVGTVVALVRPGDRSLAVLAAVVSVAGCALGSLVAEVMIAVSDKVPLAVLLSHFGQIAGAYPATVGAFGLLFWALAAWAGYRTVARPGRWGWLRSGQRQTVTPGPESAPVPGADAN
jgi:hypothetical protein